MNLKNRLPSTIKEIKKGKLNAQINLDWQSVSLSVIITTTSVEEMGLSEGDSVDVLFKASDVILGKNLSGRISARNVFYGEIVKIPSMGSEIVFDCATIGGVTKRIPNLTLGSPDLNHMPYSGQQIPIGNEIYIVEIN